jgi:TonB family protein
MIKKIYIGALALTIFNIVSPAFADAYDDAVNTQIRKLVEYPRLAKMRELEGSVGFTVKIDGSGAVSDVAVDSSSGQSSLDNATVEAVKKAAPFPAPTGGTRQVHGVVTYKLG